MSDGNSGCIIKANPDVTGIGIRLSIYILVLLGRLLTFAVELAPAVSERDAKDFRDAVESALTLQGLALLCTALYQTGRGLLSLFHAICCLHLLALLGVSIVSRKTYSGHGPWRLAVNVTVSVLATAAYIAFNTYVWAKAPGFGSQPECNAETRYVVVGIRVPATSDVFRYIAIACMAVVVASIVLAFSCVAPFLVCFLRRLKRDPGSMTIIRSHNSTRRFGAAAVAAAVATDLNEKARKEVIWKKFTSVVAMTGFSIYAVVSLEQTIQANNVGVEEREWGFGQVLALFLLLGVVNELFNLVLASLDGKDRRRRAAAVNHTEGIDQQSQEKG